MGWCHCGEKAGNTYRKRQEKAGNTYRKRPVTIASVQQYAQKLSGIFNDLDFLMLGNFSHKIEV